jgi:hypothetical protein
MQKFGVDISKWQSGFDFNKALQEGVEFVILRGAYAMSKDKCFEDFYKQCKLLNIPVGVYHYTMAETVDEARDEANFMLNILKGKQFEYPIYIDVEDDTQKSLGKDTLTAIIQAYCNTLEQSGYYVGIYSTYYFLRDFTHIDELDKYDKWIAQWASKCTSKKPYGMWQFGGETNKIRTNKVAGVTCDQNYVYKDYPAIMKKVGLNGFTKGKSIDQLAREVIAGYWSTGLNRKIRLTEAGYDYNAVQKRVNEII